MIGIEDEEESSKIWRLGGGEDTSAIEEVNEGTEAALWCRVMS